MVADLLAELAQAGARLRLVAADQLQVSAPKGGLSAELRARIAAHKPELVGWLTAAREHDTVTPGLPTISPEPAELFTPFPPSDLQTSFLIGSQKGFEHHVRPHQYLEIELTDLGPERFAEALNRILHHQRHNLVVVRDDLQLQTIRDPEAVPVPVSDLRGMPEEQVQAGIARVRAEMSRREPRIDRWPWVEVHFSRYDHGRARLHYNNNNLFSDAPGTMRFLDDVLREYRQPGQPRPELTLSYRDCILALAALEDSPRGRVSERYWRDRVADWPDAPAVPLAAGADPRQRSRLQRRELLFPAAQWTAIKERAASRGITPSTATLAAHAELLAYWSGSRHFLLNHMITHRLPLHPQIGEVLGNFASLYPLEVDWRPPAEPFQDRARRLQARVMRDVEHGYWSGVKVLQALNQVRRTPGRAVCPFAVGSALFVGPAQRPAYSLLETPQVTFDCEFWELTDGDLWVVWDVIEEMFPPGLVDAMADGYRTALGHLATDDDAWSTPAFDLLPADQRAQRTQLTSEAPLPDGLLHDPLPRQAATRPDQPAVVASGATLSYHQLARAAAQLTADLRRAGTPSGALVAVVLPKGWQQVAAVLGVLGAGAAYVPIDPDWPADRIRYLLTDTAAAAVLTDRAGAARLATLTAAPVLTVNHPADRAAPADQAAPAARQPTDLAYVIYTSGSTGRPKGVMLDHRGPLNTVVDINQRFGIGEQDTVFGVSSLSFDLSVYDIFGTLHAGATLVLPAPTEVDPVSWLDLVARQGVTVWNSVPALMQLFVEAAAAAGRTFPTLRTVLLSGDWIPVSLPARIRQIAPNARVVSLGGATEASIWSICFPIDQPDPGWSSIPYGKPLANQTWYVHDALGRDAPTWVPGELYVAGVGVAQGYLGDPARTAAAFVTHPRTGERLYRTGDLGRYLPSGDIEFLGRADDQVKIQGFRVEPGEVEHALLAHPQVDQAAVVARASGSGKQLAAFVVGAAGGDQPEPATLCTFLTDQLPRYLVPAQLTVLDALPLTGNGKLDRRALAQLGPVDEQSGQARTRPRDSTEAALAEIWATVLGTTEIGVHDDFFDLGGQSFAALRVVAQVEQRLGYRIPLDELLAHRTVAGLAARLAAPSGSAADEWSPLVLLGRPATVTPWFLVHPAGGNIMCYQELATLLERPIGALQAPGPAVGRAPLTQVADLARCYVAALSELQPTGPYLVGGWSSGAVIAFEIAHQLEQQGEVVRRVAVLDAPAPTAPQPVDEVQVLLWFLEDLDVGFAPDLVDQGRLRELLAAEQEPAGALALACAQGVPDGQLELDPATLAPTLAVFRSVVRACHSYHAPRLAADLSVLRAREGSVSEFADHPQRDLPDWGWAAMTSGAVTTATVTGTHHTVLSAPHVAAVAAALNGMAPATDPAG